MASMRHRQQTIRTGVGMIRTNAEIASALGLSEETVRVTVCQAAEKIIKASANKGLDVDDVIACMSDNIEFVKEFRRLVAIEIIGDGGA